MKKVYSKVYRNACRKTMMWKYKRVYKKQKAGKYDKCVKNIYRKICLIFGVLICI